MPIEKLSSTQLKGMDLDQLENLAKGAKVLRDPTLKGKTQLRFTNDVGMNCKAPVSEVFAQYVSLGKVVHFEEMDQYIALGKKFQKLENNKAPTAPKSVLQKFVTALRSIFESIFGTKSHREERLKGYEAAQNLCQGLQKAKMESNRKDKSEKEFDDFMENVKGFKPNEKKDLPPAFDAFLRNEIKLRPALNAETSFKLGDLQFTLANESDPTVTSQFEPKVGKPMSEAEVNEFLKMSAEHLKTKLNEDTKKYNEVINQKNQAVDDNLDGVEIPELFENIDDPVNENRMAPVLQEEDENQPLLGSNKKEQDFIDELKIGAENFANGFMKLFNIKF